MSAEQAPPAFVAFRGHHRIGAGSLAEVTVLAGGPAAAAGGDEPVLVFDLASGRVVDLDPRPAVPPPPGRGRPKLGVVAREVTLLPRHWDWLAAQSGGASAALRRLVDQARRDQAAGDRQRLAREAAYRFMAATGGDLPGFEDAARALFQGDRAALERRLLAWPADIAVQVLAFVDAGEAPSS